MPRLTKLILTIVDENQADNGWRKSSGWKSRQLFPRSSKTPINNPDGGNPITQVKSPQCQSVDRCDSNHQITLQLSASSLLITKIKREAGMIVTRPLTIHVAFITQSVHQSRSSSATWPGWRVQSQHTAGVRYSWHGCLAVTAHGQELDIRDMDGCGRVGYSWHGRCLVVTAHGRSWKVVTSMSGRHRTWQELKTILVTWIAVVTERDTAGVEYRVNLRCLSHLCSKLLWVSR